MEWFILTSLVWIIIAKLIWKKQIVWQESLIHVAVIVPITILLYFIVFHSNVRDYIIVHGFITEKVRDHGSYKESYQCNCTTVCSGSGNSRTCSPSCQTCYRTVYTVNWYVKSTIGNIDIDYSTSYLPTIYLSSDSDIYSKSYVGEHCARVGGFKNYIKGAPDSLFNANKFNVATKLSVPDYPNIYNKYKTENVFNINTSINANEYRTMLQNELKTLALQKGINIILVFVNSESSFKNVVEKKWIGGKQNDLIVVMGIDETKIQWVEPFTYGLSIGNQMLISVVRDSLQGKVLSPDYVVNTITDSVEKHYVKKSSEDFKYLAKSINPKGWQLAIITVLQLLANFILTMIFIKNSWRKYHD
jgi:energy-coupling factor transporter transmembrane protein EcfT